MSAISDIPDGPLPSARPRSNKTFAGLVIAWMRANLFPTLPSTIITLLLLLVLGKGLVSLVQWGLLNAVWSVPDPNNTAACRAVRGLGACWAVIPEKLRFILFGTYPFDQQWRPALAMLIFVALFYLSSRPKWWRKELALIWAAALVLIGVLMWGGIFGMPYISQDRWGGLPV